VGAGKKVVIVEEFKEAGLASSAVTRKVTRVVTPGTGVDESFVEMEKMNFVLALGVVEGDEQEGKGEIGLAYRDVSTGASFTRVSTISSLRDDLHLVRPKEVVFNERLESLPIGVEILSILQGEHQRESLMVSSVSTKAIPPSSSVVSSSQVAAEEVLLAYLASTLVDLPPPRTRTTFVDPAQVMQLDAVTLKSLEVRESLRGGIKGSLLHSIKRTVTPGGTRLLTQRLSNLRS
jgi:DNA mismatch repair ATPase MutS